MFVNKWWWLENYWFWSLFFFIRIVFGCRESIWEWESCFFEVLFWILFVWCWDSYYVLSLVLFLRMESYWVLFDKKLWLVIIGWRIIIFEIFFRIIFDVERLYGSEKVMCLCFCKVYFFLIVLVFCEEVLFWILFSGLFIVCVVCMNDYYVVSLVFFVRMDKCLVLFDKKW